MNIRTATKRQSTNELNRIESNNIECKQRQNSPRRNSQFVNYFRYAICLLIVVVLLFFWVKFERVKKDKLQQNNGVFGLFDSTYQAVIRRSSRNIYWGRINSLAPSPRCCIDEDCLERDQGKYAVVTMLRSARNLPLFEELRCSLQHSNPDLPLLAITVEGDLDKETINQIQNFNNTQIQFVDPVAYTNNQFNGQFTQNWIKLRLWELDEYDAIIFLDTDMTVLGDLSPLFQLPTDVAMAPDADKRYFEYHSLGKINTGMIFLRPCPEVTQHMIELLDGDYILQFQYGEGESEFLDWYFKYTRWSLPLEYNYFSTLLVEGQMLGGGKPVVLHHVNDKPFEYNPNLQAHQFFCTKNKLKSVISINQ